MHVYKELTLEDYLSFYRGNCADNLTKDQLKQVLSIHGFVQLSNSCKEYLIDAVRSFQITPPVRSTTRTNFVPLVSLHAASLPVLEMIRDIQDIGWEECPFQSVKTIESNVPAMIMSHSFMEQVPQTSGKLMENGQGAPLICSLPNLKIYKKARTNSTKKARTQTVFKKHADDYAWCFSGCMNIKGLPYKRSNIRFSGEKTTIQVPVKNSRNADPYEWHASGSMKILGLPYCRRYYKCSESGCFAKKNIDRDANDPSMCIITYKGQHNHIIS